MAEGFVIVCDGLSSTEIVGQVRLINTFPCVVRLYDRIFMLDSKGEAAVLATGLEVGWYLCEDYWEKDSKTKPNHIA